jgi:hypothetical protein
MKCKCGFENAEDAKFCGNCRSFLSGGEPGAPTSPGAIPQAPAVTPVEIRRTAARPISRVGLAIGAVVVILAGAGYWWFNRPPERYKADNSGLYPINVNGKYGYMDKSGKTIISPQFDMAYGFSESLAHVRIGTKSGYINTKGSIVITPQFDDAQQFQYGRASVKLCCGPWGKNSGGDKFGFIDKDGKYLNSPDFTWVGMFSGGFAPVKTADGTLAFVDRDGKIVPALSGKFDFLFSTGFISGLSPARSNGKFGFIDTTGKWAIEPQFEAVGNFAEGLAAVRVGGRSGYVDKKGKFVINPQYEWCDDFYEGRARVKSSGKFGFIDTSGRNVADVKFEAADHFSEGLAPVKTEEGWGFIDPTGKLVITPQFDSADMFQDGLARVTVAGKEAYVTTSGAFAVDPFPGRAGIPTHPVQEVWEGRSDGSRVRFILIREGAQIGGYFSAMFPPGFAHMMKDLKGKAAQDGSFYMADEDGRSWKGQFGSSVLINGVTVDRFGGRPSTKEEPLRLRLVRDATASEADPLPPTSSDWSSFASSFKEAVQRRDLDVLSRMRARSFCDSESILLDMQQTPAEELTRIKWDSVEGALASGVESQSSTAWGRAKRVITEVGPPPSRPYSVRLTFIQGGDNQWRWTDIDYPGLTEIIRTTEHQ